MGDGHVGPQSVKQLTIHSFIQVLQTKMSVKLNIQSTIQFLPECTDCTTVWQCSTALTDRNVS